VEQKVLTKVMGCTSLKECSFDKNQWLGMLAGVPGNFLAHDPAFCGCFKGMLFVL
jgi:hypothetical protein